MHNIKRLWLPLCETRHANQAVPSRRAAGDRIAGGNGERGGNRRNGGRITIPYKQHAGDGKAIEGNGEDIQSNRLRQHSASRVQWGLSETAARTCQRVVSESRRRGVAASAGFERDLRLHGSGLQFAFHGSLPCAAGHRPAGRCGKRNASCDIRAWEHRSRRGNGCQYVG